MSISAETAKDALDAIIERENWDEGDFWWEPETYFGTDSYEIKADVVTVEFVDGQSGGEDVFAGGEGDIYQIFKVTSSSGVQYFKRYGEYASYAGSNWQGFKEVFPREKVETVYE